METKTKKKYSCHILNARKPIQDLHYNTVNMSVDELMAHFRTVENKIYVERMQRMIFLPQNMK